jgi:hypothetical protein
MNIERFTEKAQEALRSAQSLTQKFGQQETDVEHLLLALLDQDGGLAPAVLAKAGVSTDAVWSQTAFKEKLGVSIEQLSDFEPKGEASRAFGTYFEPRGMTNRALVIVGPDGVVRWSHLADSPGDLPGVGLIFDGLAAASVS